MAKQQGKRGARGIPGPPGPAGKTGTEGAKGKTGATGAKGATGARGFTGGSGASGPSADHRELASIHEQIGRINRELHTQMTRIAQLQSELDAVGLRLERMIGLR
jgi:hypothetical protein